VTTTYNGVENLQ